jgi:hypothetical protein
MIEDIGDRMNGLPSKVSRIASIYREIEITPTRAPPPVTAALRGYTTGSVRVKDARGVMGTGL